MSKDIEVESIVEKSEVQQSQELDVHTGKSLTYMLKTENCLSHSWYRPKFQVLASNHHNGERFLIYLRRPHEMNRWNLLKWLGTRKSSTWNVNSKQEATDFYASKRALPQNRPNAEDHDWQIWFVSHATVLLQIGRYNFLTDPVWAEYVSPKQGRGPKRVIPAGIALEQLPEIHAVLLSHNHYDHMDLASLRWLNKKFSMPIYTGLGNRNYLPEEFHVIEMDWWQTALFKNLKIVYTPAQHGSGRGLRDQNIALWGGFSVLSPHGHCFFAGDTGYSAHFKEIQKRLGTPRIALLPIGAYEPRALMKYMHMNPQDAFQAHLDLQAKRSLAIHYRTFQLTDESREQPEHDLHQAMTHFSKMANPFYCLREGRKMVV